MILRLYEAAQLHSSGFEEFLTRVWKYEQDTTGYNLNIWIFFVDYQFLSDPGPIIVYACQALTDWLTALLNELT